MKRSASGYSLVEVLIAIAITAVVLLTVVTLFYMGRRNVYSGKELTYAVSVGTRMLEDLSSMSANDTLTNFNITDGTALTGFTIGNTAYTSSATVDTSGCTSSGTPPVWTCTNDPNGYLAQWVTLIDPTKLSNAKLGLIFTPRSPVNAGNPWTTAQFIKVRAYVQWTEAANRTRISIFDTTKVNRQQ